MKKANKLIFISIIFLGFITITFAQKTAFYNEPEQTFRLSVELFEKEKYGAAQDGFDYVITNIGNPLSQLRINAEYYDALCALELFNKDAEYKFNEFVTNHPSNSRLNLINFQLGRLAYRNKKYSSAQKYFAGVDIAELSNEQRNEYFFKTGYCYFRTKNFEKSIEAFEHLKNTESKYNSPANYFLAHIAYVEGDYETALAGFNELSQDKNFSPIVPYYIVQILFAQEKYEDVLEIAPELLKGATEKRKPEIARIIGGSYYMTGHFEDALPYLQQYQKTARTSVSRDDKYKLAYTLYKNNNFSEAINYFQKVTGKQDTLSQYAYYYLGACYLETGKQQFAANAFNSAYKLQFDKDIREDALFNQAQLAFELSYDPYSEAIKALKKYLQNYPNSSRNDEAYNFLFKISMATRNFKDAQEALENISVKGKDYNRDLQRITYYRGIELFNRFNYEDALDMFKKALENNQDATITSGSVFWAGESLYRMDNYLGAKKYYMDFLSSKGAKKSPLYNIANYNLGYVYFKRKEYSGAIYHFKDFIAKLKNENPTMVADAFLRLGDSWFIQKNYDNAISYYDKAIKMNAIDVDYALFQKAIALGVLQRYDEKIKALKTVITKYPDASSISEVIFELGNTYLVVNDKENALLNFRKIASQHPNSSYAVKARLKTGLIYYNSGQNEIALSTFEKVVTDYPDTRESKEALASLKNIYLELNKVDDYFDYVNKLPFADVSVSEQDSLIYYAAENLYFEGSCETSAPALKNYLEKFPEGAFRLYASFYLAECLYKDNNSEQALENYEFVLNKPKSEFTETALLKAGKISLLLEDYEKSLDYFFNLEKNAEAKGNIVEAVYGQMKSNYMLGNYEEAINFSSKLLKNEKLSDEMKLEAMVIKAKSLLSTDDLLLSKASFRDIADVSQGEAGAEAKYNIAWIEFQISNYEASEKEIFELINKYAAYDYWVAKGFILLADVYVKKDNDFQAKQTLQSIIDNYEGEELKKVALGKLDEILSREKMVESEKFDKENEILEPDTINIEGELIEME